MPSSSRPPTRPEDGWVNVRDSWVGASTEHDGPPVPPVVVGGPPPSSRRSRTTPPPLPAVRESQFSAPPSQPRPAPFGNAVPSPTSPSPVRAGDIERMLDCLARSDPEGALMSAESVLRRDARQADALQCAQIARAELYRCYDARLGSRDLVPVCVIPSNQLGNLAIDTRAALILTQVDGRVSIDDIIHAGVLTKLDALRVLSELHLMGVLDLRSP